MTRLIVPVLAAAAIASGSACRKPPADATTAAQAAAQTAAAQPTPTPTPTPEPPKPMPAELPDVLARVNGEPVNKSDFERMVKEVESSQPIPPERRDELHRKVLDDLVTYAVLMQETKARSISVPDAEVDANLQRIRQQFPNEEAFTKALASRGMTLDKLRSDAHANMAINKMMEAEVASEPEATDAQVREFYDKNPDKFKQDESVRASHILIRTDPKGGDAAKAKARAKAEGLATQAKGGADFATLARENSADGSAANGGDLNWIARGQTVAPFDKAAFSMQPGQISDVVETEFGFHVIKVVEKKAASTVPLEQASARIRDFLTGQHKQERAQAFIEQLKKKAKIEVLV